MLVRPSPADHCTVTTTEPTTDDPPPAPAPARRRRRGSAIVGWLIWLVPAVLIGTGLKTYVGEPYKVPSGSMLPTIEPGDWIVANKMADDLDDFRYGDLVVFLPPPAVEDQVDALVKRIIGLPGDEITFADGVVVRNGAPVDEPYLTPGTVTTPKGTEPVDRARRSVLRAGRQPLLVDRQPHLRAGRRREHHRPGQPALLAADRRRRPLTHPSYGELVNSRERRTSPEFTSWAVVVGVSAGRGRGARHVVELGGHVDQLSLDLVQVLVAQVLLSQPLPRPPVPGREVVEAGTRRRRLGDRRRPRPPS